MADITANNFGLLIAYLIPGFVIVASLANRSPLLAAWLNGAAADSPTVGGFLFITLAAITAGMAASVVRWLLIDSLHHRTGITPPEWDFAKLTDHLAAFEATVDNHYRYYQAYGNLLVALLLACGLHPDFPHAFGLPVAFGYVTATCLIALLFVASRDAIGKYYARTNAILTSQPRNQEIFHDKRLA